MVILLAIMPLIVMAIVAGVAWTQMRARGLLTPAEHSKQAFSFRYISLPLALLIIYAIIAAVFFNKLPEEQAAYRFLIDGTPSAFASREAVTGIGLAIQAGIVLIALGIVIAVLRSGYLGHAEGTLIKPATLVMLMGNLPALLQVILVFAMYDIFSYNAYQKHPMPLWLFAVIILVVVTIALIVFIVAYAIKAGRQTKPQ